MPYLYYTYYKLLYYILDKYSYYYSNYINAKVIYNNFNITSFYKFIYLLIYLF